MRKGAKFNLLVKDSFWYQQRLRRWEDAAILSAEEINFFLQDFSFFSLKLYQCKQFLLLLNVNFPRPLKFGSLQKQKAGTRLNCRGNKSLSKSLRTVLAHSSLKP